MKRLLFIILAIFAMAAAAQAQTVSVQPYGWAFPAWYGYSGGSVADYYLSQPTLTENDTVMTLGTDQTVTGTKTGGTYSASVITNPSITGGTLSSISYFDTSPTTLTATGAIFATVSHVELNSVTPAIVATIAAPAAGRLLIITQTDAGTAGHTVVLTAGTFDGSNDTATFNAAGETLVLFGVSATRFVIVSNIGSVALSGA